MAEPTIKQQTHGTRPAYMRGCRCLVCVEAQRLRKRIWQAGYRAGRKERGLPHRSPNDKTIYVPRRKAEPTTEGSHGDQTTITEQRAGAGCAPAAPAEREHRVQPTTTEAPKPRKFPGTRFG